MATIIYGEVGVWGQGGFAEEFLLLVLANKPGMKQIPLSSCEYAPVGQLKVFIKIGTFPEVKEKKNKKQSRGSFIFPPPFIFLEHYTLSCFSLSPAIMGAFVVVFYKCLAARSKTRR